jgi:hypothetical protein
MVLVLSVVDFPAVADRHDDDRGVILNEDHAPIADPKDRRKSVRSFPGSYELYGVLGIVSANLNDLPCCVTLALC